MPTSSSTRRSLSSLQLLPILEAAVQTSKPLLIDAEDLSEEGIVRGGGAALAPTKAGVSKLEDENADVQAGINIVLRALEAPSHNRPRSIPP
jgi:hypothetical protein